MKKLFISQPMRGKSDQEILRERETAIKSAEKLVGGPVEVIDSFFQSAPVDAKPLWFLESHSNFYLMQILHILQADGKKRGDARLSMIVQLHMELKVLNHRR